MEEKGAGGTTASSPEAPSTAGSASPPHERHVGSSAWERKGLEMKGGGYYSANTKGAGAAIMNALPLMLEGLRQALVPSAAAESTATGLPADLHLFTIADYGAADGGTSQGLMRRAIEAVRAERGPEVCVSITYTDRPSNDFTALFLHLQDDDNKDSPLRGNANVYIYACGRSFYEPNFPPASVHFGFSATAMHWLSRTPSTLKHVHAVSAPGHEEKEAFRMQARRDWATILVHRGRELAPGGRLLLVNFCVDEEGQYLGNTKRIKCSMFDVMNEVWKGMAEEGQITFEEYGRTAFSQFYRTKEEFLAPFHDSSSPVAGLGLVVDACKTDIVKCPYREAFDDGHYSAAEYSHALMGTIRSWSEGVFFSGLSDSREKLHRDELVNVFFERYRQRVELAPEDHAMDYVHCYLLLHKQ